MLSAVWLVVDSHVGEQRSECEDTGNCVYIFGTNSDDAQSQIISMMGNGMTAEDALNLLLTQATNTPTPGPPGGNLAATNVMALTSGSLLGADHLPPGLQSQPINEEDMISCGSQPGPSLGESSSSLPITSKRAASSTPRCRRLTSAPTSRKSSKPPCSPAKEERLTTSERAREKIENENKLLELRLQEMTTEAQSNEKAREFSQAQKAYEPTTHTHT